MTKTASAQEKHEEVVQRAIQSSASSLNYAHTMCLDEAAQCGRREQIEVLIGLGLVMQSAKNPHAYTIDVGTFDVEQPAGLEGSLKLSYDCPWITHVLQAVVAGTDVKFVLKCHFL